jgi:hypothetical protein
MASRRIAPPWDYLHEASITSLESYELSRLNHAANIRREIGALLDQWIEDSSQAMLARWVREDRLLPSGARRREPPQSQLPFSEPGGADSPAGTSGEPIKLAQRNPRTPRGW